MLACLLASLLASFLASLVFHHEFKGEILWGVGRESRRMEIFSIPPLLLPTFPSSLPSFFSGCYLKIHLVKGIPLLERRVNRVDGGGEVEVDRLTQAQRLDNFEHGRRQQQTRNKPWFSLSRIHKSVKREGETRKRSAEKEVESNRQGGGEELFPRNTK